MTRSTRIPNLRLVPLPCPPEQLIHGLGLWTISMHTDSMVPAISCPRCGVWQEVAGVAWNGMMRSPFRCCVPDCQLVARVQLVDFESATPEPILVRSA